MKWVIRGAIAFGILIVAVLAIGAIMLATFDPNDYKDRITAAAKNATGRDIEIAGDLSATFFPVLGFDVAGVTVGNPPGYEDETFLSVTDAQAGVELMPLLQNKIVISKIILNEPAINVIRKTSGETNLAFNKAEAGAQEEAQARTAREISVGKVEINNARVTYTDQATGKILTIDPLNMTLPGFDPGKETDVSIDFVMQSSQPPLTVKMDGSAKAKATPAEGAYGINGLKADLNIESPNFKAPLNASIAGEGSVNTSEKRFDMNISSLKADWQDTNLSGNAKASGSFARPQITFSAKAPSLNIDTLRATLGNKPAPEQNGSGQLVPVKLVRGLDLNGNIEVGELTVSQLVLNNLKAVVSATGGLLDIAPINADFYDGKIDTVFSINAQNESPSFILKGAASNIEIGGLLKDKLGQDYLTGKANVNFDLNSRGNTMQAMRSAAGGTMKFDFGEGYINKWELSRRLNQAIAIFEGRAMEEGDTSERVRFTSLDATFQGQNGNFRNDDLLLVGPKLHAFGAGNISLANQTVDYTLRAGFGENADESSRHIPVHIGGPFSNLNYGLDVQATIGEFAGEKIEEKKQELIDKALQKFTGDKTTIEKGETADGETIEPSAGDAEDTRETSSEQQAEDPAEQLLKGIFGR